MAAKKTAETRSTVRSKKPQNHAQGKPLRGIRPGVRGPNKKPDEILAEQMGHDRVIIIPQVVPAPPSTQLARTANLVSGAKPPNPDSRHQKLNRQLQDLIREIGNEVIPGDTGWTRIIGVIRRLYLDAAAGKTAATALLLERGWGKVPAPVQLDVRGELLEIMRDNGLSRDEVQNDPVLREIMGDAIDASWHDVERGVSGTTGDAA